MIDRVASQIAPEHPHHGGHRARGPRDTAEARPAARPVADAADVSVSAFAVREQRSASFTFVTADGDTVTLDSSFTREMTYASYDAKGRAGASAYSASESSSMSLSVEGTLDAEEMQDIRKALQFLKRAGKDGEIDAREVATFMNREDIDSLSSLSGGLETSRSEVALSAYARSALTS